MIKRPAAARRLARFRALHRLRLVRGRQGRVRLARHKASNRYVAIKSLKKAEIFFSNTVYAWKTPHKIFPRRKICAKMQQGVMLQPRTWLAVGHAPMHFFVSRKNVSEKKDQRVSSSKI